MAKVTFGKIHTHPLDDTKKNVPVLLGGEWVGVLEKSPGTPWKTTTRVENTFNILPSANRNLARLKDELRILA